jgi:hypothetical protein
MSIGSKTSATTLIGQGRPQRQVYQTEPERDADSDRQVVGAQDQPYSEPLAEPFAASQVHLIPLPTDQYGRHDRYAGCRSGLHVSSAISKIDDVGRGCRTRSVVIATREHDDRGPRSQSTFGILPTGTDQAHPRHEFTELSGEQYVATEAVQRPVDTERSWKSPASNGNRGK